MATQSDDTTTLYKFLSNHSDISPQAHYSNGTQIQNWEITGFLGLGGSSEVYCAKEIHGEQYVAIKILYATEELQKNRFLIEKEFLSKNKSKAFPHFYGSGEINGMPYLILELLEPLSLPHEEHQIAKYLIAVAKGIRVLHRLGYIHRDIKPRNILCRKNGMPVLIDLGLIQKVQISTIIPKKSLFVFKGDSVCLGVGTPQFSAPEQFYGGKITPASDIHALGILAFKCFQENPPHAWSKIIQKSTSSIPMERYQSINSFIHAIRWRYLPELSTLAFLLLFIGALIHLGIYLFNR